MFCVMYCVCGSDFSIAHGGENGINRHKDTSKHKEYVDLAQRQRKLTDFGASSATANLNQKAVKAERLFSGFLVEHNLPLSTGDHATKLFRNMFPDSKIVNKYRCGRTKTTHANWSGCKGYYWRPERGAVVDSLVRISYRWNQ